MNKRILLVLGASSDIGQAYIDKYEQKYDKIIIQYRTLNSYLEGIQNKLKEKIISFQADFLFEDDTIQFVNNLANIGLIPTNILHIPAAKLSVKKFQKLDWVEFQNDFDIQLRSAFYLLKVMLPKMIINGGGKIVFILSSNTVNQPPKNFTEYTTIKYAMLGFMKSLSQEYANKNIKINAVSPSMIETKFLENIPYLAIQQSAQLSSVGRNATTDDVIPMIDFLLSDYADYITGQNMVISVGQ